jgi:hypothetical protein
VTFSGAFSRNPWGVALAPNVDHARRGANPNPYPDTRSGCAARAVSAGTRRVRSVRAGRRALSLRGRVGVVGVVVAGGLGRGATLTRTLTPGGPEVRCGVDLAEQSRGCGGLGDRGAAGECPAREAERQRAQRGRVIREADGSETRRGREAERQRGREAERQTGRRG